VPAFRHHRRLFVASCPDIAIGVFSLQKRRDIGTKLVLAVRWKNRPSVEFNVCSQERPFLMTMGLFGGGRIFSNSSSVWAGLREMAAELKHCPPPWSSISESRAEACTSRSGSASDSYSNPKNSFDPGRSENRSILYGIIRAGGSVEVLGLITILGRLLPRAALPASRRRLRDPRHSSGQGGGAVLQRVGGLSRAPRTIGTGGDVAARGRPFRHRRLFSNVPSQTVWNTYCAAFRMMQEQNQ